MAWQSGGLKSGTPGTSSEDELIADTPSGSLLRDSGGMGQTRMPGDVLKFQLQLSREMCLISERLQCLECKVHSSADGYLEAQLGQVMDAGRRDAEQRRELAETFAAALQEERDARLNETGALRVA